MIRGLRVRPTFFPFFFFKQAFSPRRLIKPAFTSRGRERDEEIVTIGCGEISRHRHGNPVAAEGLPRLNSTGRGYPIARSCELIKIRILLAQPARMSMDVSVSRQKRFYRPVNFVISVWRAHQHGDRNILGRRMTTTIVIVHYNCERAIHRAYSARFRTA